MGFKSYTQWLLNLPIRWLTGNEVGQAYSKVYGTVTDRQAVRLNEAVKERMPTLCSSEALPYIATERNIIQGPDETEDHFRGRLENIWRVAPAMGKTVGLLTQLYYQGYTDGYSIQSNGKMFQLNSDFNEDSEFFPFDQIHSQLTANNILIPVDGYFFTLPLRSYTLPIPSDAWGYEVSLPTKTGIQQTNRYVLYFDSPPSSWVDGVPSESQLNTISSIVKTWGAARAIFEGIIVNNSSTICGFAVCGSATAGAGSVSYYLNTLNFNGLIPVPPH